MAKVLDYYGHGRDAWELLRTGRKHGLIGEPFHKDKITLRTDDFAIDYQVGCCDSLV